MTKLTHVITKEGLDRAIEEIRAIRLADEKAEAERETDLVSVLSGLLPNDRFEILRGYGKMASLAQRAIFVYQTFCAPGERDRAVVDLMVNVHKSIIEALDTLNGKKKR